jgi:hypothetical protein
MTIEDGNGNKAKFFTDKRCGIKVDYTSSVLLYTNKGVSVNGAPLLYKRSVFMLLKTFRYLLKTAYFSASEGFDNYKASFSIPVHNLVQNIFRTVNGLLNSKFPNPASVSRPVISVTE